MRPLVLSIICLLGLIRPDLRAEEPPALTGVRKHSTTLKFKNGTYASIFGIVPKEYKLESEETREILEKPEGADAFTLDLVSSETRRILTLPDETPTVESAPKPLTGKSLHVVRRGEAWDFQIVGHDSPTEEEKKEAQRLVARFQPGASPFHPLTWSPEGTAVVDLAALLKYLGYTQTHDLNGSARLTRASANPGDPLQLDVAANFDSGDQAARISVELKAAGTLRLPEAAGGDQKLEIEGDLTIHGQRVLPDGRKVPYSLITRFSYSTVNTAFKGS